MKKTLQVSFLLALLVVCLYSISAFAQKNSGRTFLIKQDDDVIAKVFLAKFPDRIEAVIQRQGQEMRVYKTFLGTATTVIKTGDKEILSVNAKEGRIITPDSNKLTKETSWKQRQFQYEALKIKEQLAKDMQIFRAIRKFDAAASTNTFELSYVIAAADDSIYLSEATDFNIKEIDSRSGQSKTGFTKVSFTDSGSLIECKGDCSTVGRNCTADPRVPDPTVCYTNESNCITECHRIYGDPAPAETPRPVEP